MWGVNSHYEEILGDNSTPESSISSYKSYEEGVFLLWPFFWRILERGEREIEEENSFSLKEKLMLDAFK